MKPEEISLEEQVERIRRKRSKQFNNGKAKLVLNTLFLVLAAIGLGVYFFDEGNHTTGLILIALGMIFKVIEFVLRFF